MPVAVCHPAGARLDPSYSREATLKVLFRSNHILLTVSVDVGFVEPRIQEASSIVDEGDPAGVLVPVTVVAVPSVKRVLTVPRLTAFTAAVV